ncbi:hypothetical protein NSE01_34230 [Novosphingobium sediminis]|uniref:Uncharacterized protein n=1 Tax=Novosphingobium sediminis TaxID=707214 RepID=A0A512APH0_9SPHN|nr:hypothetical protein NSE01_34230 [Novosphingobium sediminis]
MRAEHGGGAGGDIGQFVDKDRPLGAQLIDDETIVDDFVTHIDGSAEAIDGTFNNIDGARDPGAKAAGIGKNDVKVRH